MVCTRRLRASAASRWRSVTVRLGILVRPSWVASWLSRSSNSSRSASESVSFCTATWSDCPSVPGATVSRAGSSNRSSARATAWDSASCIDEIASFRARAPSRTSLLPDSGTRTVRSPAPIFSVTCAARRRGRATSVACPATASAMRIAAVAIRSIVPRLAWLVSATIRAASTSTFSSARSMSSSTWDWNCSFSP